MKLSRIMLAAPASGSGKTLITCGILQALKNRGMKMSSFKCGPDYIDPMFHGRILGISSKNLDTYFTDEEMTRYLFAKEASMSDFSILEGVMGYYDGIAGISLQASAYDVARVTKTPVVLVISTKGMSGSVSALIQGFLQFRSDSHIAGVILNHTSAMLYPRLKEQIEKLLPVKVLGYVPTVSEYVIESRHLGLVTPNEIDNLQEKLEGLATVLDETIDLDALINLGECAEEINFHEPKLPEYRCSEVRIGIAKDEAFCFYYRDNLELLERFGAELVYFSPIHDEKLPDNLNGLIFYGGYPELYAEELSENQSMIQEIKNAITSGIPYLAECGGFMYLHEFMEDMKGNTHSMLGILKGTAYKLSKLARFGYIELKSNKTSVLGNEDLFCRGHEFHYFDSTSNGTDFVARKPLTNRSWECIHANENGVAGFPHMYYYSNPQMIVDFLKNCERTDEGA